MLAGTPVQGAGNRDCETQIVNIAYCPGAKVGLTSPPWKYYARRLLDVFKSFTKIIQQCSMNIRIVYLLFKHIK